MAHRPHPTSTRLQMPEVVDNTEQVKIAKLLGVFSDNLNFDGAIYRSKDMDARGVTVTL